MQKLKNLQKCKKKTNFSQIMNYVFIPSSELEICCGLILPVISLVMFNNSGLVGFLTWNFQQKIA